MECLPTTIKERRKISLLPDVYSDTLDTDISVDVPVRRLALFSVHEFDVPVRPMDAKGSRILPMIVDSNLLGKVLSISI